MTFNPLKEKGTPLEKQLRSWHDITHRPFNKNNVDCYTRTRQIYMNGIEVEAWNFKHNFSRYCTDNKINSTMAQIRRIEDMHQTTINWLGPEDQTVLETTLGYEQVAVDLTAWLAQNEPDEYVKETFDFGLLEDFDHLYRYSQWAYMMHGINPNYILQGQTDVIIGRPTQFHHNCNAIRLRKPYDKTKTSPQTKVNILSLLSAEQQTHNYYAEHGFMYGNQNLRETYAEIKDVEEEHVTMYESLIDPTETVYEKLLLHEFTEVCNYYNCMIDEEDHRIKLIWEELLSHEIEHLNIARNIFEEKEKRDAEEIIGEEIILPSRFKSQKEYVTKVLTDEVDKRLGKNMTYLRIKDIPDDWISYKVQDLVSGDGAPSERTIKIIGVSEGCDIVLAEESLKKNEVELLKKGMQTKGIAPDTVTPEELETLRKFDLFDE